MTLMTRRAFTRAMLAAALTITGTQGHAQASRTAGSPVALRIGYQKSSTLITLLKARGSLEQALAPLGVNVSWHEFASGLPLTEALNVDAVDFSADVADTVPVFAQAAHANFVYIAQEAPSPGAQAIIVRKDGPLHTLADLKGKHIAVTKAAGSHYLLLAALAKAGLSPADVTIHYLAPADGRAAFEHGSVDAWITWDPYVASVDRDTSVRILADGNGLASYQRYYLASSNFAAAHPAVIQILFDQLSQAGTWLRTHPEDAAKTLSPIWGLDTTTIERANARRSYVVRPVVPQNFSEQQKIADTFLQAGLLPARVDTGEAQRWDFATKRAEPAGS
ncbi:ABC transporter, substrate-binding, aliphatic sulfonates family protein [Paraburkholderia xenovorans LB400]|uniref:Putative aliphatic sulfonates-binding protein n=1 Tax=Paraburkholderia xenovorans (strain LB400) TaxID=266265 RepID=Q13IK5_PARXL|nr:aliphatic sulfonate ABC transporter substrate-binding protein [Paraburkholderia xenovorans]ABE36084.1 ABC aliphatic sulfonates transporter, periplasmic ligand binding protein [Paraburkholderia xenovorans LB400]AIP34731.1 ABC transporter, substrate-binding, aliphatic sulfonates family protein [Paraburkholderia xenovorans LB400]